MYHDRLQVNEGQRFSEGQMWSNEHENRLLRDRMYGGLDDVTRHAMEGLGGTPEEDIQAFSAVYIQLRQQIVDANEDSSEPLTDVTLANNLANLDRTYAQILAGDYSKATKLQADMRNIIVAITNTSPDTTVEDLLHSIVALPAQISRGIVAAGQTAGDALRAAGIDPAHVIDEGFDTVKWVAGALGILGLGFLVWKLK